LTLLAVSTATHESKQTINIRSASAHQAPPGLFAIFSYKLPSFQVIIDGYCVAALCAMQQKCRFPLQIVLATDVLGRLSAISDALNA
jgi:hypothetical protein